MSPRDRYADPRPDHRSAPRDAHNPRPDAVANLAGGGEREEVENHGLHRVDRVDRARPGRRDHREGADAGARPGGCIITMLIGVVGAVGGGFISTRLFDIPLGGFFELRTWVIAIVGAFVLLLIYRLVAGGRSARRR